MGKLRATVERRQLGAELRRLRKAAGKQQKDAAVVVDCDISQISRVERGERSFKALEISALLDFYGAPTEMREQITDLARMARQRQPRRMYSDALPGAFRRLSDHEQDAIEIYYSESDLIPGLLQTEEYMRALMRLTSANSEASTDNAEARVQFRLERQQLLARPDPPLLWFVIGEAALWRPIGGHEVLHRQLHELISICDQQPQVVIQVAPLSIVDRPLLGGSIGIFRFSGDAPDIVHQATLLGGGVYLDNEDDVATCSHALDRLRATALGPEQSRDFITNHMRELTK